MYLIIKNVTRDGGFECSAAVGLPAACSSYMYMAECNLLIV